MSRWRLSFGLRQSLWRDGAPAWVSALCQPLHLARGQEGLLVSPLYLVLVVILVLVLLGGLSGGTYAPWGYGYGAGHYGVGGIGLVLVILLILMLLGHV